MIAFEILSYYNRYAYNNYCKKIDEAMAERFRMIADDALRSEYTNRRQRTRMHRQQSSRTTHHPIMLRNDEMILI